jgi:hypothetical protein
VAVRSRRVRRLHAEVTQAHALLGLQADDAPLRVDSGRVRRRRRAVLDAARLHQLAQDPAAQAWRAARWRRVLTTAALTALVLALGWSTAGVQHFAASGAPAGSAAWWLAWLVEPLISLALLSVVGAKAYFASRGHPLNHRVLRRVERGFLAITVTMNVWPYLPWVAHPFAFAGLFVHAIGPVVAVSVVAALPVIWQQFVELGYDPTTRLPVAPTGSPYRGPTAPEYRANPTGPYPAAVAPTDFPVGATGQLVVDPELVARAATLIRAGHLPARPSATQLRAALGCGTGSARRVRDALAHRFSSQ